jgi:hypothetical protein
MTRLPLTDEDRRAWIAALWESFDRARRSWCGEAARTGAPVPLAVAQALQAIWSDHEVGAEGAIRVLSEWARPLLDPTEVEFSPQVRAARARWVLELVIKALHGEGDGNPAAPIVAVSMVGANQKGDLSLPASRGRHRRAVRAQLDFASSATRTPEQIWGEDLPVCLMMWGNWLLPSSLQDPGQDVDAFAAQHLVLAGAREATPRHPSISAQDVRRVREHLLASRIRAPAGARWHLTTAALESARPRVELLQARSGRSAVRRQAQAILSETLRAWGMPSSAVEDLWRGDTKALAPDPPRGRRVQPPMLVVPLVGYHAVIGTLRGTWAFWQATAPLLEENVLLRVLAVLSALTNACHGTDEEQLLCAGSVALQALRHRVPITPLSPATEKARAMAEGVETQLAESYASLVDDLGSKAGRAARDRVVAELDAGLRALVIEYFPWLAEAKEAPFTPFILRQIRGDLRELRRRSESGTWLDTRRACTALAHGRAEKLIRKALRTSGMPTGVVRNLFALTEP